MFLDELSIVAAVRPLDHTVTGGLTAKCITILLPSTNLHIQHRGHVLFRCSVWMSNPAFENVETD